MGKHINGKELQRGKWTFSLNKTKQKPPPVPGIVVDSFHSQSQTTDSETRTGEIFKQCYLDKEPFWINCATIIVNSSRSRDCLGSNPLKSWPLICAFGQVTSFLCASFTQMRIIIVPSCVIFSINEVIPVTFI